MCNVSTKLSCIHSAMFGVLQLRTAQTLQQWMTQGKERERNVVSGRRTWHCEVSLVNCANVYHRPVSMMIAADWSQPGPCSDVNYRSVNLDINQSINISSGYDSISSVTPYTNTVSIIHNDTVVHCYSAYKLSQFAYQGIKKIKLFDV